MTLALSLAVLSALFFGPFGILLDRAAWPSRAPRAAIALWQAIGLAGGLAAVGAGLAVTGAPLHGDLFSGVVHLIDQAASGHPLQGLGLNGALGLTLATDVGVVLAGGLVLTSWRHVRPRAPFSSTTPGLPLTACPVSAHASSSVPARWGFWPTMSSLRSSPMNGVTYTNAMTWSCCPSPRCTTCFDGCPMCVGRPERWPPSWRWQQTTSLFGPLSRVCWRRPWCIWCRRASLLDVHSRRPEPVVR